MNEKPVWEVEGQGWPNRAHSRFLRVGELLWHVQTLGEGPVVLLLHGTGAATHSWRDLAPILARRFTVVAPDLPGHGFTSTPADMSLPAIASALGALLLHLQLSPAMVVGHSAGAAVAVRLSVDGHIAPEVIASIGGALLPFPGLAAMMFPVMAKMLFVNPFMPQLFTMQARRPGEVERFLLKSTGSKIDAEGVAQYEKLFRSAGHVSAVLGMMANWDLVPIERDLPALKARIALLHGDRDKTVPPSVARSVAGKVPASELLILPGLGHLAHEERPEEVAAILLRLALDHGVLAGDAGP